VTFILPQKNVEEMAKVIWNGCGKKAIIPPFWDCFVDGGNYITIFSFWLGIFLYIKLNYTSWTAFEWDYYSISPETTHFVSGWNYNTSFWATLIRFIICMIYIIGFIGFSQQWGTQQIFYLHFC